MSSSSDRLLDAAEPSCFTVPIGSKSALVRDLFGSHPFFVM
ncbi:hypothetical protein ACTJJY_29450 [Bacillus sp. 22475]